MQINTSATFKVFGYFVIVVLINTLYIHDNLKVTMKVIQLHLLALFAFFTNQKDFVAIIAC